MSGGLRVDEVEIRRLRESNRPAFRPCGVLFTAMTNHHAEALPEVFAYPGPVKDARFVEELVQAGDGIFIASCDGEMVGAVHAAIRQTDQIRGWQHRRYGYIERLWVEPAFRRRGIGRGLVERAEDWIAVSGCDLVELNTWTFNEPALTLFEHVGYKVKNVNLWHTLKEEP